MKKPDSQISRQARWQRKHRALGLCVLCSRRAFKVGHCRVHYERHNIKARLRYIPQVRGRSGGVTDRMLRERLKELNDAATPREKAAKARARSKKLTSARTSR